MKRYVIVVGKKPAEVVRFPDKKMAENFALHLKKKGLETTLVVELA